jgi:hypothetical protein
LVVNPEEAERIREMFRLYLEGTPVLEIVQRFDKLGWRNKQWTTQDGKPYGGSPLRRCHIYKLLGNLLYTGRVTMLGVPRADQPRIPNIATLKQMPATRILRAAAAILAVLDVDNPRPLRMEFHSQLLQDSKRRSDGRVRLGL